MDYDAEYVDVTIVYVGGGLSKSGIRLTQRQPGGAVKTKGRAVARGFHQGSHASVQHSSLAWILTLKE